ncbi:MAG: hypothetical protein KR126chlam1_00005 [Chlamydiae bacterium]|nr:hypothetical protein [Chlamydiota bacterium]
MSQPTSSGTQTKVPLILQSRSTESKERDTPFSSQFRWPTSIRKKITEIGQTDPQKASLLSRKILFFQGTQAQREELRNLGHEVPEILHRERLVGGVLGEGEGGGLLVNALKGAVRLLVEGNQKEVKEQAKEQFVKAQVQLPSGEWIEGQHEGGRILSNPKRSVKSFGTKRYHLLAYGLGKFLSKEVKYEGDFVDDLFHDLTGDATYFIEQDTKYTGCFYEGKRSGHGVLEKYDQERGEFYLYYRGTWKDDHPETGFFFSTKGEEIAEIKDGMMQKQKNPQILDSSSPEESNPPPSQIALGKQAMGEEEAFVPETRLAQPVDLKKRKDGPERSIDFASSSKVSSSSQGSGSFSKVPSYSSTRSRPALRRQSSAGFDPTIPPEEACPLIGKKLSNPHQELSIDESIELLTTCVRYGNERAKKIEGKEAVIVIGNTGAGKSTMVNYLAGCTMELKSPKELGLKGIKKIVVVRSHEKGGTLDEIMPIGHTKESKTFMPQIETDSETMVTFCDCPGFLDNRGAEINIANAVNVKNAIIRAKSVKLVILINYHSLMADRGRGLSDMLKICSNLFGRSENLKEHASSLLLGITQAPLDLALEDLKEWIVEDTPDVMQALSKRLFLFDPLDRDIAGGWKRDECLSHLKTLPSIENPSAIFKTVLTDSDEKRLLAISEQMGSDIQTALRKKNFQLAASRLKHLQTLSVIEHITVERLLSQNFYLIGRYFQKTVDDYKEHCNFEHFSAAATLMKELQNALDYFGPELEEVTNLEKLTTYYEEAQKRYDERIEKERIAEKRLQQAQGRIEELIRLLEEQKQSTLEQIKNQDEKYSQMQREMEERIESIQSSYVQMQEALQKELDERLAKKEEEFKIAQSLNQQGELKEINQEKEKLEAEYRQKIEKAEQEKRTLLSEQETQKVQREREMAAEQERLKEKIRVIDAQKIEQTAKLPERALPEIAFGKASWEQYFGDVGEEPPLPDNIEEILKSPCPFWEGKKVEDTHLLVLIPKTVDRIPLSLDLLEGLITRPLEGGHRTQYGHYDKDVEKELGNEEVVSPSYWVLITNDVLPDSRNKSYKDQGALIDSHKKRIGISYEIPQTLEAAVSISMHHVRSGEKLYKSNPHTLVRCRELVRIDKYPVAIGSFDENGIVFVPTNRKPAGNLGVAAVRKFPEQETLPAIAFGKAAWEKYFGEIGEVPPLPDNIEKILKSPCPLWGGKKVEDTHILVLVPETLNGQPLSTKLLEELVQSPGGGGHATQLKNMYGDQHSTGTRWILMTKGALPGSLNKSYKEQCKIIENHRKRGNYYRLPYVQEAIVAITTHYIRSGERLYKEEIYTSTQNVVSMNRNLPICVGGYTTEGLIIGDATNFDSVHHIGIAGVLDIH